MSSAGGRFPARTLTWIAGSISVGMPNPSSRRVRMTTVGDQRKNNIHVHDGIDEATFVAMRTRRDEGLGMPTLLLPAIQVNVRAGNLPPAEDNGVIYLKIPLNKF